jgi:hypothetical protein
VKVVCGDGFVVAMWSALVVRGRVRIGRTPQVDETIDVRGAGASSFSG